MAHVVRLAGDHVIFGGMVALKGFDTSQGDGALIKLSKTDGSLAWATMYYTGKGPDEIAEHRVKGLAVVGSKLYVAGQIYTGNMNG